MKRTEGNREQAQVVASPVQPTPYRRDNRPTWMTNGRKKSTSHGQASSPGEVHRPQESDSQDGQIGDEDGNRSEMEEMQLREESEEAPANSF